MSARVSAIANQKGGVGKTVSSAGFAASLTKAGKRVAVIGFDSQGSLEVALGFEPDDIEPSMYDVMYYEVNRDNKRKKDLKEVSILDIKQETKEDFDLFPSNIDLALLDIDLVQATSRELILRGVIRPLLSEYDEIIIDCLPSLGLTAINVFAAADQVLVPLKTDYLALRGVRQLINTINMVQHRLNPQLTIGGVFYTMAAPNTLHTFDVVQATRNYLGEDVNIFTNFTRESVDMKDCTTAGLSIVAYASKAEAAQSYLKLTQEVFGVDLSDHLTSASLEQRTLDEITKSARQRKRTKEKEHV